MQARMVPPRDCDSSFAVFVLTPVTVVIVATDDCDPLFSVTVEGSREQVAYATVASGVHVSATEPANPFVGAALSE